MKPRKCKDCGEESYDKLCGDNNHPTGKRNLCKTCNIIRIKKYDEATPEKRRARQIKWRSQNYIAIREKREKRDMTDKYGLTSMAYYEMFKSQNGQCAICKTDTFNIESKPHFHARPVVDHCHATGKVRGLLCNRCNRAIGLMKDDVCILENAVRYLQK